MRNKRGEKEKTASHRITAPLILYKKGDWLRVVKKWRLFLQRVFFAGVPSRRNTEESGLRAVISAVHVNGELPSLTGTIRIMSTTSGD